MPDSSRSSAIHPLLRRCWPIAAAIPLGALCGGAYAAVAPVHYQANAYVMVVPEATSDTTSAVDFAQAYGRVITQPEILMDAAASTGVPMQHLAPLVQAVTSPDAPMVQITGTAGTAAKAAEEANAVARSLVAFGNAATKQTRVTLSTFADAAAPAAPSSPSRSLDVAVGAAAGLLIGGLGLMARQSRAGAAVPAAVPSPRIEETDAEGALTESGADSTGPDEDSTPASASPESAARRNRQASSTQGRR